MLIVYVYSTNFNVDSLIHTAVYCNYVQHNSLLFDLGFKLYFKFYVFRQYILLLFITVSWISFEAITKP